MIISWYGEACFLLENGGARILIEPLQKKSGIAPPRLKSDILICRPDADIANSPFIINGPGEYEVKGISVWGVADKANTVYIIEMEKRFERRTARPRRRSRYSFDARWRRRCFRRRSGNETNQQT